jgi:branched-chain amino acid transport system substrate-binding protein
MLVVAACGSSLTDQEVLAANGVDGQGPVARQDAAGPPTGAVSETVIGPDPVTTSAPSSGDAAGEGSPTEPSARVGTPGETGPIVIGSVGNYSGPAGAAQVGIPRAVQVWAANVNAAGGLFGRQVKVIVQDDGGDPARYASAVQDLVENRKVIAFVGQAAVLSVRGGVRYLADKGIPVIGTDCAAPEWFAPSTNLFPQCSDAFGLTVPTLVTAMKLNGATRLGYLFCGESPACTSNTNLYDYSPTLVGGQAVFRQQISIAQIDFTAQCQAAQQAGVQVMSILAEPGTIARVVRSCERQGFRPHYAAVSISVLPDVVKLPGLERVVLGTQTFPWVGVSTPAIDEFHRAMERHLNGTAGPAESVGWTAAKLFELAANRAAAASGSLSPKTLIEAMRTIKGEDLGGLTVPLDFTGPQPTTPACGFILQGDGAGGWTALYGAEPQCVERHQL